MRFVKYVIETVATGILLIVLYVTSCLLWLFLVPAGIGTLLGWLCAFLGVVILFIAGITKGLDHHAVVTPELLASVWLIFGAIGLYAVLMGGAALAMAARLLLNAKIHNILRAQRRDGSLSSVDEKSTAPPPPQLPSAAKRE